MHRGFAGIAAGILLVGLIAAATLILAGAFYLKQNKKPQSVVQTTVQPSPLTDETTNWKTYTNEEYGFEFRYPNGWQLQDNYNGSISIKSPDFLQNPKNRLEDEAESGASILVILSDQNYFSDLWEGQILKGTDTNEDKVVSDVEQIKVDGRPATEYNFKAISSSNLKGSVARINNGDRMHLITITYASSNSKVFFDQILSTFKFTD